MVERGAFVRASTGIVRAQAAVLPLEEADLHRNRALAALLTAALLTIPARARAQAPPEIALETLATGLAQPTAIAHAADSRLFLTLQRGQIVLFENGRVLSTPFLDIRSLVSCCGERGLLGLAFHPRHSDNGFFFVDYTNTAGDTVIARYHVSAGRFQLAGTHTREHGGPIRKDEKPDTHPARYNGAVDGDTMTFTVTLTDSNEVLGAFTLTRGRMARVVKCL